MIFYNNDENTENAEINEEAPLRHPDANVTTTASGICIHSMVIAGQIEGHFAASPQSKSTKYEQCIPTLVAVEENDEIDGLLLLLNTIGGDIEAGLAIAELISGMTKPTVSIVLGGGHSIGVPLAVSADRSLIVPSATMTLHPVRMNGLVIGVPQTYAYFAKMQERIVAFVTAHSHCDSDTLNRLIMSTDSIAADMGTIIDGREAVACGIIDAIGGLSDAMTFLRERTDM